MVPPPSRAACGHCGARARLEPGAGRAVVGDERARGRRDHGARLEERRAERGVVAPHHLDAARRRRCGPLLDRGASGPAALISALELERGGDQPGGEPASRRLVRLDLPRDIPASPWNPHSAPCWVTASPPFGRSTCQPPGVGLEPAPRTTPRRATGAAPEPPGRAAASRRCRSGDRRARGRRSPSPGAA